MSTHPVPYITPEQYLAIERQWEIKHQYYAGEMFAKTGASEEHNLISANVLAAIHQQFRNRACKLYSSDMRDKISDTGLYTYPDVVATCDTAEFEDSEVDSLLNPLLLAEVFSESTEAYNRGKKFEHYRKIASSRECVLIAQDRHRLERYARQDGRSWALSDCDSLETEIELTSIGCRLAMADVYDKVDLLPKAPA